MQEAPVQMTMQLTGAIRDWTGRRAVIAAERAPQALAHHRHRRI